MNSVPYLQVWLNVHPLKHQREAALWTVQKGMPERLGYAGLYRLVKKLKKKTNIKKPLRPNYLRHAGLTEWAKILPEQKLKVLAGWTPDSRMAAIYIHLAGKDPDEDVLKAHGKEVRKEPKTIMEALKPRVCQRCGHESPATYLWCGRCGMVLDKKTALEIMEKQPDPLLQEIEQLSRLGYREVFTDIVEYAKARFAEQLKQQKIE